MPDRWYFDWLMFWILVGVTLWEGVQRVPAGTLLLRRTAGYPWHVAGGPYVAERWRLVSWLSPLVRHVALRPGPGCGRRPPRRLGRAGALLCIPGFIALLALVVGLPLLTPTLGARGFLLAAALALGASLGTAVAAVAVLRWMGVGWKPALRDGAVLLSPFAAPRAGEVVLARGLEGVAFVDALRCLLPEAAYVEWARPMAYDQLRGGVAEPLLPAGEAEAILRAAPVDFAAGDAYCARCGRVYLPAASACRACDGVALVRVGR